MHGEINLTQRMFLSRSGTLQIHLNVLAINKKFLLDKSFLTKQLPLYFLFILDVF